MTRMTILTKTIVIGTLLTGILTSISPASGAVQGFVAGRAFLDVNENGKRDAGEGTAFSLYKVTNGGSYFSCGYTGKGSTFGVPVSAGTYWVMPIAPKGFRTTTPIIKAEAGTDKPNIVEIGIVQDVSAPTDYCGQYSPKRVIRQNGLGLLETAGAAGFNTLLIAINAAGLTDALNGGGPFTVFAPNDLAFAKFTDEEIAALLADKVALANILKAHVVSGKISVNDAVNGAVLQTLGGQTLKIEQKNDEIFINGARVVATDINTANGIIHVIDTVIVP